LEQNSDTFDWVELENTCKLYNCDKEVFKYILLVNKYMQATVPAAIISKYTDTLTIKEEELFLKYLSGFIGFTTGMHRHFGNFQHITSFQDKVRYFFRIIFPTKKFMLTKFQLKNPGLVYFYYPYRYFIGLKGIYTLLKKKIK